MKKSRRVKLINYKKWVKKKRENTLEIGVQHMNNLNYDGLET